jgi:hypothetical protein
MYTEVADVFPLLSTPLSDAVGLFAPEWHQKLQALSPLLICHRIALTASQSFHTSGPPMNL